MNKYQKYTIFLLRITLGWLFFYAGITKILNPDWSAAGYIGNAKTLTSFYEWMAGPAVLPVVNFLNQWGLTLVGVALLLGLWVRWASYVGILIMALYYIPILSFPYVGSHSYLVDEHIIYILVFVLLITYRAGNYWGIDKYRKRK